MTEYLCRSRNIPIALRLDVPAIPDDRDVLNALAASKGIPIQGFPKRAMQSSCRSEDPRPAEADITRQRRNTVPIVSLCVGDVRIILDCFPLTKRHVLVHHYASSSSLQ